MTKILKKDGVKMKITTKGRHAVRIMIDIARSDKEYISISEISNRQHITTKYLEQIISLLVKKNLLESMRGASGGYKLTKKVEEYSIKEILDATGDTTELAECLKGKECPVSNRCDSVIVWRELTNLINDYLEKVTLKDLIKKAYGEK